MNGKLRLILDELARPSAQKADWFAWAAAQLAHAMIGVALAGALAFLLPGLWFLYRMIKGLLRLTEQRAVS